MKSISAIFLLSLIFISCEKNPIDDGDGVDPVVVTGLFDDLVPIAEWNFDSSDASDKFNTYNGIIQNETNVSYETGISGNAIRLNGTTEAEGTGSYIDIPFIDFTAFDVFGMELYVKSEDMAYKNGQMLLFFGDLTRGWAGIGHHTQFPNPDYTPVYHFSTGSHINDIYGYSFETGVETQNIPFNHNEWVKLSLRYEDGMLSGYMDDVLVNTIKQDVEVFGTNAAIGKHYWNEGKKECARFSGLIDEVKIFAGKKST